MSPEPPTERQLAQLQSRRRDTAAGHSGVLRQIERNLHDGPQAHLATIIMLLGRADEHLAAGEPTAHDTVHQLVRDAKASAHQALEELRELAQGVRPAVLDNGLAAALENRAEQCALPVRLSIDLPECPSPAVEDIAFYCVSELLTNAVKHAAATDLWVTVRPAVLESILIRVRDNGRGGVPADIATTATGSGLAGLQWRVNSVDGLLSIRSPRGEGTEVTVTLPLSGPR